MRVVLGVACMGLWLTYAGQIISVVDLRTARRLGLQEAASGVDRLFVGLEVWTARWDLLSLWTLPTAGILMLVDSSLWPWAAMIGGAVYVDTAGRETAKWIGLRRQGVRTGSPAERRAAMALFSLFLAIGGLAIAAGAIDAV